MKKLLALSLMLALITAAVFGQFSISNAAGTGTISLSEWGRGVFVPAQIKATNGEDPEIYAGVGAGWGPDPELGITVEGKAERFGFTAQFFGLDGVNLQGDPVPGYAYITDRFAWGLGHNVFVEVFPIEWLRIRVGKFLFWDLRGTLGTDSGDFHDYVGGAIGGGDFFDGMTTNRAVKKGRTSGALISAAPIDGLLVAVEVQGPAGGFGDSLKAEEVYQELWAMVGYKIPNIGHIRVQYVGDYDDTEIALGDDKYYNNSTYFSDNLEKDPFTRKIEAAFAFTMLEQSVGLTMDVGGKIFIPVAGEVDFSKENNSLPLTAGYKYSYQPSHVVSLGAKFKTGALEITGTVQGKFAGHNEYTDNGDVKYTYDSAFGLKAHIMPTYNLGFGTVGANLGFWMDPETTTKEGNREKVKDSKVNFGAGAFFRLPISTATLTAGVGAKLENLSEVNEEKMVTTVTIPVVVTVSF